MPRIAAILKRCRAHARAAAYAARIGCTNESGESNGPGTRYGFGDTSRTIDSKDRPAHAGHRIGVRPSSSLARYLRPHKQSTEIIMASSFLRLRSRMLYRQRVTAGRHWNSGQRNSFIDSCGGIAAEPQQKSRCGPDSCGIHNTAFVTPNAPIWMQETDARKKEECRPNEPNNMPHLKSCADSASRPESLGRHSPGRKMASERSHPMHRTGCKKWEQERKKEISSE